MFFYKSSCGAMVVAFVKGLPFGSTFLRYKLWFSWMSHLLYFKFLFWVDVYRCNAVGLVYACMYWIIDNDVSEPYDFG